METYVDVIFEQRDVELSSPSEAVEVVQKLNF
jgi:hypothetical protein